MTNLALRPLGNSGLSIAPLVLGGNVFGWTADKPASFAVLDAFADGGGVMIDTADVYSAWVPGNRGGESETLIGEWLRASGKRDKVLIATKVGMAPWDDTEAGKLSSKQIAAGIDGSLQRLGTDRVDLYYAHQDSDETPQEAYIDAFAGLVEAGKVRVLGASNFTAARLKSAVAIAKARGSVGFKVLQPEYNLVSRGKFEGDLQDFCVQQDIAVLPYSSLASGFLTGKYRSEADLSKSQRGGRVKELLTTKRAALDTLDDVAAETGATPAQVALAWLRDRPGVTAPIASATTAEQVAELLPAMSLALSDDQRARLDAAG